MCGGRRISGMKPVRFRHVGFGTVDANHDGNGMRCSARELTDLRLENKEAEMALRGYLLRLRAGSWSASDADDDAVGDAIVIKAGAEIEGAALRSDIRERSNSFGLESAGQPARIRVVIIDERRDPDGKDDLIRSRR